MIRKWSSHGYDPNPLALAHPSNLKEQLPGYGLECLPSRVLQTHMLRMEWPLELELEVGLVRLCLC